MIDYNIGWDNFWIKLIDSLKGEKKKEWLSIQNENEVNYHSIDANLINDKIVVEVGCGIGRIAKGIAKGIALKCKKYYGFDISLFAINKAKEICPKNAIFNIIDIEKYKKTLKEKVDTFISKEAFIHIGEQLIEEYLIFANNILKKNGKIWVNFYYNPNKNIGEAGIVSKKVIQTQGLVVIFTEKEIRDLLKRCNFVITFLCYKNERYIVKAKKLK